jgi:hypothetical protein
VGNETVWQRITRRVIRDLIGIDDSILAIIFGEGLPSEAELVLTDTEIPQSNQQPRTANDLTLARMSSRWEDRLLERVARELGILVHQFLEHPGAFSTYHRAEEIPGYVGSTRLPRSSDRCPSELGRLTTVDNESSDKKVSPTSPADAPHFSPTLLPPNTAEHASNWGVDDPSFSVSSSRHHLTEGELLQREREYWERELDVNMMFSFLRNRFRRGGCSRPLQSTPPLPRTSPQTNAARAAMIRQQHPLTSRAQREVQAAKQ